MVTVKIPDLQNSASIRVFDMYGRMVMQQNSSQRLTQLNVSKLTSGVYIVRVKNAEQENAIKIIKQ
ncbi:MAG TPA: T9SS type A sorting domain-containing protein [Chitinophagaceae bacterium]|nr:T9SS type A sorting domain-containing protein [Chitinophagaceae bacterium]